MGDPSRGRRGDLHRGIHQVLVLFLPPHPDPFHSLGRGICRRVLGIEGATDWHKDRKPLNTPACNLSTAVEEGMEKGGVTLFIYALLGYMGGARRSRIELDVAVN